jgi:MFS family permease
MPQTLDLDQFRAAARSRPVQITLVLTATLTPMAFAPLSPSLPLLKDHFADVESIEYLARIMLTLPAAVIAICSPLAGYIVDRFGRRRLLLLSAVLYGLAGAAGPVIDSIHAILASRAIMGIAIAGVMTASQTLLADYVSGRDRQRFMGIRSAVTNFGSVVFNAAGGLLAALDWRAPFLVFLAVFLLLPFMVRFLHEPPRGRVLWEGDEHSASAPGAPAPYAFIAMIYLQTTAHSLAFFMIPTQIPFLIRDLGEPSPIVGALAISTASLGISLSSLIYVRLRRFGTPAQMFALAFLCLAGGYAITAAVESVALVYVAVFIAGFGLGTIFPNGTVWLIDRTPQHVRGRVIGGYTTSTFVGHFSSPLVSQTMAGTIGFAWTFGAVAMAMAAIAVAFWAYSLRERR